MNEWIDPRISQMSQPRQFFLGLVRTPFPLLCAAQPPLQAQRVSYIADVVIGDVMRQHGNIYIAIHGHTDDRKAPTKTQEAHGVTCVFRPLRTNTPWVNCQKIVDVSSERAEWCKSCSYGKLSR